MTSRTLILLDGLYAIVRLARDAPVPDWVPREPVVSITRTTDELSIVCDESRVPPGVTCSRGWCALRVQGAMDLSETGVLASIATPLARGGVNIFALSTYDTDYLLIPHQFLDRAGVLLSSEGHAVLWPHGPAPFSHSLA